MTAVPPLDEPGAKAPPKAKGLSAWLSAHKVEATMIGAGGLVVLVLVKDKLTKSSSSSSSAPATVIQPAASYPQGSGGGSGGLSSLQSQIASLDTEVSSLASEVSSSGSGTYSIVPSHAANLADQAAGTTQYQWDAQTGQYVVDTNPSAYNGVTYTKGPVASALQSFYQAVPSHAANLADQAANIPQYQLDPTTGAYVLDTNPNAYNGVTYTRVTS